MHGMRIMTGGILLLVLLAPLLMPAAGAVTRGQTFTVTITGKVKTAYDVWPEGTHFMTGEPGDQPPLIAPGQVDVIQDPPGGPYVIGNHPIRGGGTIRDDVPPDSSTTSATAYYAEVTTDASGLAVVLFETSAATSTQQFHIEVENPANLDEEVGVVLGEPTPFPTPVTTTRSPGTTTSTTPTTPVTTVSTTVPTTVIPASPPETPPSTPPQQIPVTSAAAGVAVGSVILGIAVSKRR